MYEHVQPYWEWIVKYRTWCLVSVAAVVAVISAATSYRCGRCGPHTNAHSLQSSPPPEVLAHDFCQGRLPLLCMDHPHIHTSASLRSGVMSSCFFLVSPLRSTGKQDCPCREGTPGPRARGQGPAPGPAQCSYRRKRLRSPCRMYSKTMSSGRPSVQTPKKRTMCWCCSMVSSSASRWKSCRALSDTSFST